MSVFEVWYRLEGGEVVEITLLSSDNKSHGWLTEDRVLEYIIYADTWDEAMTEHHKIEGWEPYKPMDS